MVIGSIKVNEPKAVPSFRQRVVLRARLVNKILESLFNARVFRSVGHIRVCLRYTALPTLVDLHVF